MAAPSPPPPRLSPPATAASFTPSLPFLHHRRLPIPPPLISFSYPFFAVSSPLLASNRTRSRALSINGGEGAAVNAVVLEEEVEEAKDGGAPGVEGFKFRVRPCELYVCNLPRSVGIDELLDLFRSYGIVNAVEISRDAETGLSRGCGYVTMSSVQEAKAAIAALDKSDIGGREMRVRFSGDMNSVRNNNEAFTSIPKRNLIFESPYRIYVGNLAWSVKPEDLRQFFSQFGTVASARLLFDRNKGGKKRVYGFVSFSSKDERKAALEANGAVFRERVLSVREVNWEEQ